jgi:hypothetical protein
MHGSTIKISSELCNVNFDVNNSKYDYRLSSRGWVIKLVDCNTGRNTAMNNLVKQKQFLYGVLRNTFRGTLQCTQLGIRFSHYNMTNTQAFSVA